MPRRSISDSQSLSENNRPQGTLSTNVGGVLIIDLSMSSATKNHSQSLKDDVEQTLKKRKHHIWYNRGELTLKRVRRKLEQEMSLPLGSLDTMKDLVRRCVDSILQEQVEALQPPLVNPFLGDFLLF